MAAYSEQSNVYQGRWSRSSSGENVASGVYRVDPDALRHVVFPNNIRDLRMSKGHVKLMPFSAQLPGIPYIRLSKIERGEVFARADELTRIAAALDVPTTQLLIDVAAPDFDIASWFAAFSDGTVADDPREARIALVLAAAVRRARAADPLLTASAINDTFGIAPVILSRIENAHKGLSRWSADVLARVGRMLGGRDEQGLREWLDQLHASGELDPFIAQIGGHEERLERTRQRIAALTIELDRTAASRQRAAPADASAARIDGEPRRIALNGAPGGDGTIALGPTDETIAAPAGAGARAYAVRIGRATLGPGLPAGTIVVVDPDRYPHAGGLALVREDDHHRLVSVIADRTGALVGYSLYPEREIALDALDTDAVAAVTNAIFA